MRLHVYTLDEREAMRFRAAGWHFRKLEGSEWELTWNNRGENWPADPRVIKTENPYDLPGR